MYSLLAPEGKIKNVAPLADPCGGNSGEVGGEYEQMLRVKEA
jgi:hypothetical protein